MKYLFLMLVVLTLSVVGCSPGARELFKDKEVRALAVAAANGDTNKVDQLIAQGVDVNAVGKDGCTALGWTFIKGNKIGFEHLLQRGANPNVRFESGDTLLFRALDFDDSYYLEGLLKYGGNPNQRKPWINRDISLLWYLVDNVCLMPDKIQILIKYGADLHELDSGGLVSACAMMNRYQNVYIFLMAGAPFSTNREPSTLLERIENRAVHPDDPEYLWRNKVVGFLRDQGVEVTPKEWKSEE